MINSVKGFFQINKYTANSLWSNENNVIYFLIVIFHTGGILVMCDCHNNNYISTLLPLSYIKINRKYSEMQQTLVKLRYLNSDDSVILRFY